MKPFCVLLLTIACVCVLALSAVADKRAKTEDGKSVILYEDGTWLYADDKPAVQARITEIKEYRHDKAASVEYKGKRGTFVLYLPSTVWKKTAAPRNTTAEVQFVHKDKDAYGMILFDHARVPVKKLMQSAVEHLKRSDPDAQIMLAEKRRVNGNEVSCLLSKVTIKGNPFIFYGYYYTGEAGSIQLITWTGESQFGEMKPDMETFLNGFDVVKK